MVAAAGCNDDLMGYRLARLADANALQDGSQDAVPVAATDAQRVGSAEVAADDAQVGPLDVATDGSADAPPGDVPEDAASGDCEFMTCNDNSQCTDDSCANGKCSFMPIEASCEDGDLCTVADTCSEGTCVAGAKKDCNDNQPCTLDSCEKTVGCVNKPNDGGKCTVDACSTEGVCIGTSCVGSVPMGCEPDGNPCTSDACDANKGCTYPPQKSECSDGNGCTTNDTCDDSGECKSGQGCHADATCKKEGELGNQCVCKAGFQGDGFLCIPQ